VSRPTVTKGPASHYASAGETIVEFSDGRSGGLISIRRDGQDRLVVDLYRLDDDVVVRHSGEKKGADLFVALFRELALMEPPEGSGLSNVLDGYQEHYDRLAKQQGGA